MTESKLVERLEPRQSFAVAVRGIPESVAVRSVPALSEELKMLPPGAALILASLVRDMLAEGAPFVLVVRA